MADFSALKTAIQTYIKQNGNEEITGDILQEILLSVVTTLGDSAINDLVTALANEVSARQNADGTLQQNITNEATARGNADTVLGGRIDDEATARANGDTALSNRLGSTITAQNTAADQIGAEAEAREAADTALQELIDGITDNIENGYVYAGIATPSSTPATGKVFYLALTAGTYTNFGNTEVTQGINILKYNGSAWSLDAFIGIDDEPTPNSPKLVKSGGVFDKVMTNGSAFDISAHFASGSTLATYADLSAALTALNTLSADYKRGGMSIKYVQSSDNKYVQFRLMSDEFSTTESDWQGVDDTPTAGSDNLVKSGGVSNSLYQYSAHCNSVKSGFTVLKKFIGPFEIGDVIVVYVNNIAITGNLNIQLTDENGNLLYNQGIGSRTDLNLAYYINSPCNMVVVYQLAYATAVSYDLYACAIKRPSNDYGFFKKGSNYNYNINKVIKELYLSGTVAGESYYSKLYKPTTTLWLQVYNSNDTLVAEGAVPTNDESPIIVALAEKNSSGISGKALIYRNNIFCLNNDEKNYIIQSAISNIDNSPTLKAFENAEDIQMLFFLEANPQCAYFDTVSINDLNIRATKELYLTGLEANQAYNARIYVNQNNTKFYQIWKGGTFCAQCTITSENNVLALVEQNNSGVSGFVVCQNLNEVTSQTANTQIKPDYVGLVSNSKQIDDYLHPQGRTYIVAKNGGGDYTSLLECILTATQYSNSVVRVEEGTYDLVDEFEAYYGSSFFTDYDSSVLGIMLKSNIHIVFSTKSVVTFNYTGDNADVMINFSPFNSAQDGFTIENLHLTASRCRYCVHDERASSNDFYQNKYINCNFYLDNTNNTAWASKQCIGGGLGKNGYIEVRGCVFESVGISGTRLDVVSWHNASAADAKSNIIVADNYFKGLGTFRLSWYGSSTLITTAVVTNNSLGSEIVHRAETSDSTVENTEIIAWNNIVRS